MPDRPFEIIQLLNGNSSASNGMVTVISELPCFMRKRRGLQMGVSGTSEMLYAQLPDGVRVYIKQHQDNTVAIRITKREVYS